MFLGKLVLQLAAETSSFGRDMAASAQHVERLAKKIRGVASDVAQFSLAFTAAAAGAAATAAKFDAGVGRALDKVKGQFSALAVEVGRTLQPAMAELADFVGGLVRMWRELDPATKEQISNWVTMAAKIGLTTLAISKVAGLVKGLAEGFGLVANAVVAAFSIKPLLPFLAMLTGIIAAYGAIKNASEGVEEVRPSKTGGGALSEAWRGLKAFFGKDVMGTPVMQGLSGVASSVGKTAQEVAGQSKDDFLKGLEAGLGPLTKAITDGLSPMLNTFGKMADAFDATVKKGAVAAPLPIEGQGFRQTTGPSGRFDLMGKEMPVRGFQSLAAAAPARGFEAVGSIAPRFLTEVRAAMDQLTGAFVRASGLFGQVVMQVVQGNWMGAVATLVASSEQFQSIAELAAGAAQHIANSLGSVLEVLTPVIDVVAVGFILLGDLLQLLAVPLKFLVDVALRGLFEVLKGVALIIMGIATGLSAAWNGIVGAIQSVFRALGSISIFGGKPLDFLNEWADGLEGAKAPVDQLTLAMAQLAGLTYDEALAKAHATAEQLRLNKAVAQAVEEVTNLPSGYKVALARFNASEGQAPPMSPSGGGSTPVPVPGGPPSAGGPGGGGQVAVEVNIDGRAVIAHIEAKLLRDRVRSTGRPLPLVSRYE